MTSLKYEVRETEKCGKGVFATTFIPAGTLIVSENPIFTTSRFFNSANILHQFEKLSKEFQELFLSFTNRYENELGKTGIAKTNCVPMPEKNQVGLFEIICRMNHSCRANSQYFWNDVKNVEVCHAIMDIKEGEEITVCYSEIESGQTLRSSILEKHKFECYCQHCTTKSPEELAQSDKNLNELTTIIDATPWLLQTKPIQAIKSVKRSLEILKIENLPGIASTQYYDGFQVAVAWDDSKSAKVWAEKTAQAYTLIRGQDYVKVAEMNSLAKNPQNHRLWKAMGRTCRIEMP